MWILDASGLPVERRVAVNDPFRSRMTLISLSSEINRETITRQIVRDHMDNDEYDYVSYIDLVPGRISTTSMHEIIQSFSESPMTSGPAEGSRPETCAKKRKFSKIVRLVLVSLRILSVSFVFCHLWEFRFVTYIPLAGWALTYHFVHE